MSDIPVYESVLYPVIPDDTKFYKGQIFDPEDNRTVYRTDLNFGPLADSYSETYGYKAFWYPWYWQDRTDICKLPYRLQWPKNYDPNKKYPLMILCNGGYTSGLHTLESITNGIESGVDNVGHMKQASWLYKMWDPTDETSYYHNEKYEAFVMFPQLSDTRHWLAYYVQHITSDNPANDNPIDEDTGKKSPYFLYYSSEDYYYEHRPGSPYRSASVFSIIDMLHGSPMSLDNLFGLDKLVADLVDGTNIFYNDSDVTNTVEVETPNIDPDRIYMSGYSYGAISTVNATFILRDKLAGCIANGATVTMATSSLVNNDWYRTAEINFKKHNDRLADQSWHVPLILTGGKLDDNTDWVHSVQFGDARRKAAQRAGGVDKTYLIGYPSLGHSAKCTQYLMYSDSGRYFDTNNFDEQVTVTTKIDDGYVFGLDWLFEQRKSETPDDPYPILPGDEHSYHGLNILREIIFEQWNRQHDSHPFAAPIKRSIHNLPVNRDNLVRVDGISYYITKTENGISVEKQGDESLDWTVEIPKTEYAIDEIIDLGIIKMRRTKNHDLEIFSETQYLLGANQNA